MEEKDICVCCGSIDYLYEELCEECSLFYTQGKQNKERRDRVLDFYIKENSENI